MEDIKRAEVKRAKKRSKKIAYYRDESDEEEQSIPSYYSHSQPERPPAVYPSHHYPANQPDYHES